MQNYYKKVVAIQNLTDHGNLLSLCYDMILV